MNKYIVSVPLTGAIEDGLIEAVKKLISERDKYRQLHDMEVEARKATRDAMTAEIQRLHERIEAIEKSHVVSLRLMEETSESWRLAHQAWSKWARELLYDVGRQPLHGEHGDTAAMAIIEQLARMAPGVPRCSRWRAEVSE